ncbi:D-glycero-beta-D-manno-heptose 1-phosphate adenylyltransferase [Candidatus Pacearchaeota archaeon]|nr:MAG: D-glycero-beta-D-manno-heptose 1-phosphate adenylyltransferase [Candidatus Pacearchaeota archaeon]
MIKISLAQIEISSDLEKNLKKIKEFLYDAKGDFVFFPELSLTGYQIKKENFDFKKIEKAVNELQKDVIFLKKHLFIGVPILKDGKIYNSVIWISPQEIKVISEKKLLFPQLDDIFEEGNQKEIIYLNNIRAGILICFELRSPEIARFFIKNGAELLIILAQWPLERIEHWKTLLKARAIENQVYVIGVNAIGKFKDIVLGGNSCIISPSGEIIKIIPEKETLIECEITTNFFKIPYPLKTPYFTNNKVKTLEELLPIVEKRRKKGQKMVFTNGCFDILHAGHVDYLEKARNFGDFLVIGLNTDNSIKKIKGSSRPINSQEFRAKVLAGLECVDYIVFFDEEIPEKLIKVLKPDFLVKGADWEEDKIVGANFVKSYGGKVKRIKFIYNTSTTQIINRIKKLSD